MKSNAAVAVPVGRYLDVKEAAQYMRVSVMTLYKKASAGLVPCRKHFGRLVFVQAELDKWSAEQAAKRAAPVAIFQSRFQSDRDRLRSLKTKSTQSMPEAQKGA